MVITEIITVMTDTVATGGIMTTTVTMTWTGVKDGIKKAKTSWSLLSKKREKAHAPFFI